MGGITMLSKGIGRIPTLIWLNDNEAHKICAHILYAWSKQVQIFLLSADITNVYPEKSRRFDSQSYKGRSGMRKTGFAQ